MLVVGRLEIAEEQWLELVGESPDPWSFDLWLGALRPHTPVDVGTRSELLRSLRALDFCDCRATTSTTADGPAIRFTVSGWLRDHDFLDHGAYLVEIFLRAYALGGAGTLWFLDEQTVSGAQDPDDSYVLHLAAGQARLEHPSRKRQEKVLATPTFGALRDRVEQRLGARD
jgi:hypothetical protein